MIQQTGGQHRVAQPIGGDEQDSHATVLTAARRARLLRERRFDGALIVRQRAARTIQEERAMSDNTMVALGEDYPELRDSVRQDLRALSWHLLEGLEDQQAYPTAFINELTEAGFLGALIPEEYGGSGLPLRAAAVILEEINATGCVASQGHAQMYIMGTLLRHGSEEQKRQLSCPGSRRAGSACRRSASPSRPPDPTPRS